MRTRQNNWAQVLAVLLASTALLVLCFAGCWSHAAEPEYEGQSLSEWLKAGEYATNKAELLAVHEAVRSMGKEAVPFLVARVRDRDSAVQQAIDTALILAFNYWKTPWRSAAEGHLEAEFAFCILAHEDAVLALPALRRLELDPVWEVRSTAAACVRLIEGRTMFQRRIR
jgi:HEAT repeat protein